MFVLLGVVSVVGDLCLFFDVRCRLHERDEEKEGFVQGVMFARTEIVNHDCFYLNGHTLLEKLNDCDIVVVPHVFTNDLCEYVSCMLCLFPMCLSCDGGTFCLIVVLHWTRLRARFVT